MALGALGRTQPFVTLSFFLFFWFCVFLCFVFIVVFVVFVVVLLFFSTFYSNFFCSFLFYFKLYVPVNVDDQFAIAASGPLIYMYVVASPYLFLFSLFRFFLYLSLSFFLFLSLISLTFPSAQKCLSLIIHKFCAIRYGGRFMDSFSNEFIYNDVYVFDTIGLGWSLLLPTGTQHTFFTKKIKC